MYITQYKYWDDADQKYSRNPISKVIQYQTTTKDDYTESLNDDPSFVVRDRNGSITHESWHQRGDLHRTNGPAHICYGNDNVLSKAWYYGGNNLHDLIESGIVQIETDDSITIDSLFTLEMIGV